MKSQDAVALLAALAQETRIDALRLLVRAGPDGLSAGAISERLDVPAPTLSFHLKELRSAGVVSSRRDGRSIVYRADFDVVGALVGFLTEECCSGAPIPDSGSTRAGAASGPRATSQEVSR